MNKNTALKKYFGYDTFRPLQAEIIDTILDKKDVLVLMPTGGGKSICFQIPAVLNEGLTVVISPLIALMKDQVEALRGNGVKASYLNSSLAPQEQDAVMWAAKMGELKLLYIAPERLFQANMMDQLREYNVGLFAIDESHCISSWGHDFRPEYRQLSSIKEHFPEVPIVALTATADKVTRRDICKELQIPEENTFISSFDRPNISLEVLPGRKRMNQIQDFLNNNLGQSGIIYCLSRKSTESVADGLKKMGFDADYYHAGLNSEKRSKVQERFINDDLKIVVATIAFGMGIDKSNVRWVIHYNMPSNVESFYQEIGRSGRDGTDAQSILFYSYADVAMRADMINKSDMPETQKELMHAKLERMRLYAESNICRRRILISYFNEDIGKNCGNCDVCKNPRLQFDATELAQKALSAIVRTQEKIAMTMLVDILRGSRNQNVFKFGYEQLPTFGVGKNLSYEVWIDYIMQFLNFGAIDIAYDEGHSFKLNDLSWKILKGETRLEISEYIPTADRKKSEDEKVPAKMSKKELFKNDLFEKLRILRKQIADALGMPPYIVFSDKSLLDMADKKPITKSQFLAISGVGAEKLKRFGDPFMKEILAYINENSNNGLKLTKGGTNLVSYELYKSGKTVEEIAMERKITTSTVMGHLIFIKSEGGDINLKDLIDSWTFEEIKDAILELGIKEGDAIRPVFEHFEGNISYGQIKLVMSILENGEYV